MKRNLLKILTVAVVLGVATTSGAVFNDINAYGYSNRNSKIVKNNVSNNNDIIAKISKGEASLNDYAKININSIDKNTLYDVNWYVKNNDSSNERKIKSNVTKILNTLTKINNGTTTLSYYKILGISGVTTNNASTIKSVILSDKQNKGRNLTKAEIEKAVEEGINSNEVLINKIQCGNAEVSDYKSIGLTNVTEFLCQDVNEYVKNNNSSDIKKIKSNVNKIVSTLARINNGTTTLSYYKILGISDVTANNASTIKSEILSEKKNKGRNLTKAEIEQVVEKGKTSYDNLINKFQTGTAEMDDFYEIGIKNISDPLLYDINWYLRNNDSSTINKVKSNVMKFQRAFEMVVKGTRHLNYYKMLGVYNVNSNNIDDVINAINIWKSHNDGIIRNVDEIKTAINIFGEKSDEARNYDEAVNMILTGRGDIEDYVTIGMDDIDNINDYIMDVNYFIYKNGSKNVEDIKANTKIILEALNALNNGTTSLEYYKVIGLDEVTSENVEYVKQCIQEQVKAKGRTLAEKEIILVVKNALGTNY